MEIRNLLKKSLPFIAIIIAAALARIIPHAPNFAPIGGLALFTGYHFKNKISWIIPLAAMLVSDYILGFHSTVPYVYASFIVISFIGAFMKRYDAKSLLTASLISSVLFFVVTNFGVWMTGSMYVKNIGGLAQSYILGIPFFRNTLLADVFYSFSFFYGFAFLSKLDLHFKKV